MSTYHHAVKIERFTESQKRDYSKFKHGSKSVARRFGKKLVDSFIQSREFASIMNSGKNIVVCSAPYNNIITASFALKDYFVSGLVRHAVERGVDIEEAKIRRIHTYTDEYGEMTAQQRMKVIEECKFHVDPLHLAGKHVIFIDDCRISGAHESGIERMIAEYDLDITYSHIYYAALTCGKAMMNVEDEINNYAVKNISDILELIFMDEFIFNTRVVKKILRNDFESFDTFVTTLRSYSNDWGVQLLTTLLTLALLNGYHKDESMTANINALSEICSNVLV